MDARWEELIAPTLVRVEGEVLRRVGVGSVALDGGDYLAWLGVGHGVHCLVGFCFLVGRLLWDGWGEEEEEMGDLGGGRKREKGANELKKTQNMIRQWRHRDHYHSAALSEKEKDKMGQHVGSFFPPSSPPHSRTNPPPTDHCIEHLRQTTLCHADTSATSLATFRWTRQDKRPMFDADDGMVHECVDWDVLVRSLVEGGRVVREGEVRGLRNPLFDYGGGEGEGGA